MRTVRRLFYRDIVSSVGFVALAFLSLFYFIDFVDGLDSIGRRGRGEARVLFVDYLTLLPPGGVPARPLSTADADLGRRVAGRLAEHTAAAAAATGCGLVPAAAASQAHHAWSTDPWTVGAAWWLPWRPAPFHPNAAGMRAVAGLVAAQVTGAG